MSTFTDLEKDAVSVDGFVNENGLIETRRNGPKPSYQYLVDGWNSAQAQNLADSTEAVNELLERTAGVGSNNAYETKEDGLSATVDGDYFSVEGSGSIFLTLYKNNNGVAEEISRSPSANSEGLIENESLELVRPVNVFEDGTQTDNGYYGTSGTFNSDADFYSTAKTPVSEGDTVRWSVTDGKIIVFFDSNDEFISSEVSNESIAPPSARTFSVSMRYSEVPVSEFMVTINRDLPSEYTPFSRKYLTADVGTVLEEDKNKAGGYVGLDDDVKFKSNLNDCLDTGENLIDIKEIREGGYYNDSGVWFDNNDFWSSPFVNVSEGVPYSSTGENPTVWVWWDDEKSFISSDIGSSPQTAPANAKYLTKSFRYSEVTPSESVMIVSRPRLPDYQISQGYVKNDLLQIEGSDINCIDRTENLFNPLKIYQNGYFGVSGSWNDDNDFYCSDFIAVSEGLTYSITGEDNKVWTWWDEDKNVVSGVVGPSPQVAPNGARYLTRSWRYTDGDVNLNMVVEGNSLPSSFIKYGYKPNDLLSFPVAGSPLSGKTIAGLGDSITFGYIPRNYPGYPGQLESYLPKIASKFGANYLNYGISGTSLSTGSSQPDNNFISRYESMSDDADLVIVMGGTNDVRTGVPLGSFGDTTTGTFYGDLYILCEGLLNKYRYNQGTSVGKDKKIMFMTAIRLGTTLNTDLPLFNAATIETCKYFNIPVFDAYNESGLTPELFKTLQGTESGYTDMYNPYVTDGTHPTDEGNEIFANAVHGFINSLY